MPNSEGYVKRGESTIITTGMIFSLHHSATISYHFDKIFTPNVLEMTLLSNDVKLHANDWTFLKLSVVEREIDNILCEISNLMTENIKFTPFYFHINLCMQCPIICRSSVKISSSESFSFPSNWSFEMIVIEKWIWLTADVCTAEL